MVRRGGSQKLRGRPRSFPRNFCDPTSTTQHNSGGGGGGGGLTLKKFKPGISQLRALATHTPILGPSLKAPWS